MDDPGKTSATGVRELLRRLAAYLEHPNAASLLVGMFIAVLLLFQAAKLAMTFLLPSGWQISGYYLDGAFYGVLLGLGGAWLASIVVLAVGRQYKRSLGRLLVVPPILLVGGLVTALSYLFVPSRISGWPIDTAYSPSRGKHYVLAYDVVPTDTCYLVFSAKSTLVNPIWKVEFDGNLLDYSEDGSLTENPHLILSGDEKVLVIGRGGHLTDAILIDAHQPLTQFVPWADQGQWQRRTDLIAAILARHASPTTQPVASLADAQIRTILQEFCRDLGRTLTRELSADGWRVTCQVDEVRPDRGRIQLWFVVECAKGDTTHHFVRDMTLVEDSGCLLMLQQDGGISWSSAEEKRLCERVRDLILEHAGAGTLLE